MILALFALLALTPRIERLPLQVALDPTTRMFHFKGCPEVRFKEHSCVSLRKDEYAVRTERCLPRDPTHIAVLFIGNSLTYFNEMRRMTQQIGAHENRPLSVDAVTLRDPSGTRRRRGARSWRAPSQIPRHVRRRSAQERRNAGPVHDLERGKR